MVNSPKPDDSPLIPVSFVAELVNEMKPLVSSSRAVYHTSEMSSPWDRWFLKFGYKF